MISSKASFVLPIIIDPSTFKSPSKYRFLPTFKLPLIRIAFASTCISFPSRLTRTCPSTYRLACDIFAPISPPVSLFSGDLRKVSSWQTGNPYSSRSEKTRSAETKFCCCCCVAQKKKKKMSEKKTTKTFLTASVESFFMFLLLLLSCLCMCVGCSLPFFSSSRVGMRIARERNVPEKNQKGSRVCETIESLEWFLSQ